MDEKSEKMLCGARMVHILVTKRKGYDFRFFFYFNGIGKPVILEMYSSTADDGIL